MTRRYLVIYESGPTNMSGFAPDVPGCVATGRSLEEMRSNLREALEFHLQAGCPIRAQHGWDVKRLHHQPNGFTSSEARPGVAAGFNPRNSAIATLRL
jgi:predicted RNase H-like HicB family nuclease